MGDMYCGRCHRFGIHWVGLGGMNEHTRCPHCQGTNCQQMEEEQEMSFEEAEEICDAYNRYDGISCTCFQGNPPCSKCSDCPSKEDYLEACKIIDAEDK